jgi:hypothetical protein
MVKRAPAGTAQAMEAPVKIHSGSPFDLGGKIQVHILCFYQAV